MNKNYNVILTRDTTESVVLSVEAASEEEAQDQVLKQAGKYGNNVTGWEDDENGQNNEIYVTGVEEK